jgi:LEA14-like dessication related protein
MSRTHSSLSDLIVAAIKRPAFWYAVAIVFVLTGCTALFFKQPDISLAGITVMDVSWAGQRLLVRLRIDNPNNYDLPIDRVVYDLDVNGQPFVTGESMQAVRIPRLGSAILEVTAVTDVASTLRQMVERATARPPDFTKKVQYHLRGTVIAGNGDYRVPFERHGEVDLNPFRPS